MEQTSLIFWTLVTGIISALATGLGAIPVHFVKNNSLTVRGFASATAAGMMISASVFSLAQEGIALKDHFPLSPYIVILGLMLGAAFFHYTEKNFSDQSFYKHYKKYGFSKRGLLIFIAMFIHSIPEGIAIGVAFATENLKFGLVMAIAITVHNIPEGIAISLPLKAEGVSTRKCAWISILTSVPQPVMAVPAVMLAWLFQPLLPIGLGFAGGAMIYLTMSELIPSAIEDCGKSLTAWGVMIGLCLMLLITTLLDLLPVHI
ncbi:MAG: ZIP family metal transporter [Candidatus Omnitrophica bacterium]|nr:ZIP family metal transporter [Candidatus Omnitrophota bacterium]